MCSLNELKVHMLVSEPYIYQTARCNEKKNKMYLLVVYTFYKRKSN